MSGWKSYFYVGGYGGFDRIAATAVKRAKQKYPDANIDAVNEVDLFRTAESVPQSTK